MQQATEQILVLKKSVVLGCDIMWLLQESTFRRNISPPNISLIPTLMIEAIRSSETSVLARATRHIPEDGRLYSHRHDDLEFCKLWL
jgi:hypothetical protein